MRVILRSGAPLLAALSSLFIAGCAREVGDVTVLADQGDKLSVDVTAIDHALVVNASTRAVFGWETAPSDAFTMLQDWDDEFMKAEGRLGTATLLLSQGPVSCDEATGDAPPAGTSGLFFVLLWWTTAEADPEWEGEYGVGGVIDDAGTARLALVGSWTESGALDWPGVSGTATLDSWGARVSGGADLDVLDAEFTGDLCGEVESVR